MKTTKHILLIFLLFAIGLNSACRKEELEFEQAPSEESLIANSPVANLMQRTSMNDGSKDNIIDYANCFSVQLPVNIVVNDTQIAISTTADFDDIEDLFDLDNYDADNVEIIFPITIILPDFTQVAIDTISEFNTYVNNCNGENETDDDIECVDFQYPITTSIFNTANELISTVALNNDEELYHFIETIDSNDIINVNFPITLLISDGTTSIVNNLNDLKDVIENFQNECDEDDDFDFYDDDCPECSPLQLRNILTTCSDWQVDKLERNDIDYDNAYDGYLFNFFTDGTLSVYWTGVTVYGTWTISGTGNNMRVDINIPSLPYCNLNWNLHEIDQNSAETKIDLREGGDDRLRYKNNCN